MAASRGDLHINAPELLSRRQRLRDTLVTGLMWLLYTYLWVPLISMFAWLLGFEFAYDVMVRSGGAQGLKQVLAWYGVMLAAIVVVVTGWSLVNRLRFAHRDRRQGAAIVGDKALAETFGVQISDLRELREARVIRLTLDQDGNIGRIEPSELPQRVRDGQNERSQSRNPTSKAG